MNPKPAIAAATNAAAVIAPSCASRVLTIAPIAMVLITPAAAKAVIRQRFCSLLGKYSSGIPTKAKYKAKISCNGLRVRPNTDQLGAKAAPAIQAATTSGSDQAAGRDQGDNDADKMAVIAANQGNHCQG